MSRFLLWLSFFASLVVLFVVNMTSGWLIYYAYPHIVYDGKPEEIVSLIDYWYPRFRVEALRLGEKSMKLLIWQMIFRINLLYIIFWLSIFYRHHIKLWLQDLIFRISKCVSLLLLWRVYFAFMAFYIADLTVDLWKLHELRYFYKPGILLRYFLPQYPSLLPLIAGCMAVCGMALVQVLPGKKSVGHFFLGCFTWALFVAQQHLAFSFEKIEHTYTSFNYFGFFMLPAVLLKDKLGNYFKWSWPMGYARLSVALIYFFAGMEKILLSGFSYFSCDTFTYFIAQHRGFLHDAIQESRLLCTALPSAAVMLQIIGCWFLLSERFRKITAVTFIIFHISTYLLMGVGGILSPWIAVMVLFLIDKSNESANVKATTS